MSDPLSGPLPPPSTPPPLLLAEDVLVPTTADPPPPYPSRDRRRTPRTSPRSARRAAATRLVHTQSTDSEYESPIRQAHIHSFPAAAAADPETNENTPLLLAPPSPRSLVVSPSRRLPSGRGRPRSLSHTSVVSYASAASSLAQTVISLFQEEGDSEPPLHDDDDLTDVDVEDDVLLTGGAPCAHDHHRDVGAQWRQYPLFSRRAWRRYFRPLTRRVYYMALFHLLVLNFPYALAAWVYLFVFTLTGTTLMIALPLGTVLCFLDLLGARAFARGELALQSTFHHPLGYPAPYPPRPIFTRLRTPTASEIEAGLDTTTYETSFYKNAYSMFTDSTSYQALFYFLVIKPSITLLLSVSLLVLCPLAFALILPAPAFLRAMRKLGVWQANVAIEGLYLAVS